MSVDVKDSNPGFSQIGVGFQSGSGAPTHTATKGTLYVNLDGSGTDDRMYINTDGATTWTEFTTGA